MGIVIIKKGQIVEGRFQSVSEVIRAGLRKLEDDDVKLQALRLKLQAGDNSPFVDAVDSEAFVSAMHQKTAKNN